MLHNKLFRDGTHAMILYCPGDEARTPYKRSAVFVLTDGATQASVTQLCTRYDLFHQADKTDVILCFPCVKNWRGETIDTFRPYYNGCDKPDDDPWPLNDQGIPLLSAMLKSWHPMLDTRYIVGIGSGADFALRLSAEHPELWAAVWSVGGRLPEGCVPRAPMPVWLTNPDARTVEAFRIANQIDVDTLKASSLHKSPSDNIFDGDYRGQKMLSRGTGKAFSESLPLPRRSLQHGHSSRNPAQQVIVDTRTPDGAVIREVWATLMSRVRRTNTCPDGDVMPRIRDVRQTMTCTVEDDTLDGTSHTWFVHVPEHPAPGERFPLVVYFHGGSDNPAEAAEGCYLDELGDRERFITVYPWATNRCSWNSAMEPDLPDDAAFACMLIRRMLTDYPVDARRVYLSGFSNGAAMAQTAALLHPELVAAIFHIDSNWPGKRVGYQELDWRDVIPFAQGMKIKQQHDYLMPVWYTYGSRELSYPVRRGSSQQHQYDFWKMYNHLPIRPTPEPDSISDVGCGVHGDVSESLHPDRRHPGHWYEVERFLTHDGVNLFNYVVMHDKGHEVAEMDPVLGWQYVRLFGRDKDGTLLRFDQDGTAVPVRVGTTLRETGRPEE